jgi:hypothetical protein
LVILTYQLCEPDFCVAEFGKVESLWKTCSIGDGIALDEA